MQQIQGYEKKPPASYILPVIRQQKQEIQSFWIPVLLLQVPRAQCFRCGEPFSRQHMKECRAQIYLYQTGNNLRCLHWALFRKAFVLSGDNHSQIDCNFPSVNPHSSSTHATFDGKFSSVIVQSEEVLMWFVSIVPLERNNRDSSHIYRNPPWAIIHLLRHCTEMKTSTIRNKWHAILS